MFVARPVAIVRAGTQLVVEAATNHFCIFAARACAERAPRFTVPLSLFDQQVVELL